MLVIMKQRIKSVFADDKKNKAYKYQKQSENTIRETCKRAMNFKYD